MFDQHKLAEKRRNIIESQGLSIDTCKLRLTDGREYGAPYIFLSGLGLPFPKVRIISPTGEEHGGEFAWETILLVMQEKGTFIL